MGTHGERCVRWDDQQFTLAKTLNDARNFTPPIAFKAENKERLPGTARTPAKRTRRTGEESSPGDKQWLQERMSQVNRSRSSLKQNLLLRLCFRVLAQGSHDDAPSLE
jgi:hypothetical protein